MSTGLFFTGLVFFTPITCPILTLIFRMKSQI